MRKIVHTAMVIAVGLLVLANPTVANDAGEGGAFVVVDTRQGAVRYNARTGESWLLDTDRDPAWKRIREPGQQDDAVTGSFHIEKVEWVNVVNNDGQVLGLQVRKAPADGPFRVLEDKDLVTALNGDAISSTMDLHRLIWEAVRDEEEMFLTVTRDGEEKEIEIKVSLKRSRAPAGPPKSHENQ